MELDKQTMDICNLADLVKNAFDSEVKPLVKKYYYRFQGDKVTDGENLKIYLQQLQVLTEELIRKDFELGKGFYHNDYRITLEYIGLELAGCHENRFENLQQLYQEICRQIIDFSNNLEESGYGLSVDIDYDIYLRYFIKAVEEERKDIQAGPEYHPNEVIARIDQGKATNRDGNWYESEERNRIIKDKIAAAGEIKPKINRKKLMEKITPGERKKVQETYSIANISDAGKLYQELSRILNDSITSSHPVIAKEAIIFEQMLEEEGIDFNEFKNTMSYIMQNSELSTQVFKGIDLSTATYRDLLREANAVSLDATDFFRTANSYTNVPSATPIKGKWTGIIAGQSKEDNSKKQSSNDKLI